MKFNWNTLKKLVDVAVLAMLFILYRTNLLQYSDEDTGIFQRWKSAFINSPIQYKLAGFGFIAYLLLLWRMMKRNSNV